MESQNNNKNPEHTKPFVVRRIRAAQLHAREADQKKETTKRELNQRKPTECSGSDLACWVVGCDCLNHWGFRSARRRRSATDHSIYLGIGCFGPPWGLPRCLRCCASPSPGWGRRARPPHQGKIAHPDLAMAGGTKELGKGAAHNTLWEGVWVGVCMGAAGKGAAQKAALSVGVQPRPLLWAARNVSALFSLQRFFARSRRRPYTPVLRFSSPPWRWPLRTPDGIPMASIGPFWHSHTHQPPIPNRARFWGRAAGPAKQQGSGLARPTDERPCWRAR